MPGRDIDRFVSPNDYKHEYTVTHRDDGLPEASAAMMYDTVTIISLDGAVTHSPDQVAIDSLKRRPRLGKTVKDILSEAETGWVLGPDGEGLNG